MYIVHTGKKTISIVAKNKVELLIGLIIYRYERVTKAVPLKYRRIII